jgi:NADPH:quinone reductase-like Zn-dependent oxidoreductase
MRRGKGLMKKILLGTLGVVVIAVVTLGLYLSHDSPCGTAPTLAAGSTPMQAITQRCYGSPEVLRLEDLAKPTPADDELLVKVRAASVNPLDWHYMRGLPYLVRTDRGQGAPQNPRLGVDFAGVVEAVGKDVKKFHIGDEVFGGRLGAFGEYVVVREERAVVLKPANISFEDAAAVPIAALTALQGLRDAGHIKAGQKVLINGASGGVGTYAVQIAKSFGAEVTGVCSTRNVEMVKSLGADHVIDYTKEDYTKGPERYDLILDNVGNHPLLANRRVMTENGSFVIIGGPNEGRWLGPMTGPIKAMFLSPFVSQEFGMLLSDLKPPDLAWLRDQLEAGRLKSVIDRRYPLSEVPAAIAYLEEGHARGKVVITID